MWPPLFIAPGVSAAVQFIVRGDVVPDSVVVSSAAMPAPAVATLDAATGRWTTGIIVPAAVAERGIEFTATASLDLGTLGTSSLMIPVITDSTTIEPTLVDVKPTIEAELTYGSGDSQVAFVPPQNDLTAQVPASIGVDPRNGAIVILDSSNHRLVILTGPERSFRSIQLPDTGTKDEVVINGDTGQATVSEFQVKDRHKFSTVYLVDLDTGSYTTSGPLQTPADPPFGLRMIWSDANAEVYADLPISGGGLFPYYDTIHQRLNMSATPETWWSPYVKDGVGAGFTANGTSVITRVPYNFPVIEEVRVATDGTIWWMVGSVDRSKQGPESTHLYLAHTDPACHTTIATEIEYSVFRYDTTRVLAIDGPTAYVAHVHDDGYQLERYELPPITC